MKINLKSLTKYLIPAQSIAGLEMTDTFLRFMSLDGGGKFKETSLRLPPGIISLGKVKDDKNLMEALRQLRLRLGVGSKKIVPAVVTISAIDVYTQIFNLPYAALTKIEEAAKLNLQMISPIDLKNVYSDWQTVGDSAAGGGQLEILGAFIRSEIVDKYLNVLRMANFSVAALEFTPLSLARAIKKLAVGWDLTRPYVTVLISNEGIDFFILKNGNLYFNRFVVWPASDIGGVFSAELQKMINFYYGKWGDVIGNLILISPEDIPEIKEAIKDLRLTVQSLNLGAMAPASAAVFGAALRGQISRAEDNFISLTSTGTEEEYYRERVFYFIGMWRNILMMTAAAFVVIFLTVNLFLSSVNNNLGKRLAAGDNRIIGQDLTSLEEAAKMFNGIVNQALVAKKKSLRWLATFNQLWITAGREVVINRLHFNPVNLEILLGGNSVSELEIINFKNRIGKLAAFENVSLPLAQIVREGKKISFQMALKVKK